MLRRSSAAACLVLLALTCAALCGVVQSFLLQEYNLVLQAEEGGSYCVPIGTNSGFSPQCIHSEPGFTAGFDVVPADLSKFSNPIVTGQPLVLEYRPGAAVPAKVAPSGAVYLQGSFSPGQPGVFSFEVTPGVTNETIEFGAHGSSWMYLTGDGKYCSLGTAWTNNLTGIIVCNKTDATGATRFRLLPNGISWMYRREGLKSVFTGRKCGNTFFQRKPVNVTCDGGASVKGTMVWYAFDMYGNFNTPADLTLPLRNGSKVVQLNWIEYGITSGSLGIADKAGGGHQLRTFMVSDNGTYPTSYSYQFQFVKAAGSSGPVIRSGDTVYLKAAGQDRWCGVTSRSGRSVMCVKPWSIVRTIKSKFQFRYYLDNPAGRRRTA